MPDASDLVTTTFFNRKIIEVENKIPSGSGLVKKTNYDAKINDIEKKKFTTTDYNKFANGAFDVKIKQKEWVNKSDIDKKLININKKITSNKKLYYKAIHGLWIKYLVS